MKGSAPPGGPGDGNGTESGLAGSAGPRGSTPSTVSTRTAPRLARLRASVDAVDDVLVAGLAARGVLVRRIARVKQAHGVRTHDPARELRVRARGASLARRLGLPSSAAEALLDVAIADAHRLQSAAADLDQGERTGRTPMIPSDMTDPHTRIDTPAAWLRWLPPPARVAPLLRIVPRVLRRRAVERAVSHVLASTASAGELEFMRGRRIGIEVADLELGWTLELQGDRIVTVDGVADASVRGTVTDLLLLASRLEDADTLFFLRRLVLTGDTELGLHARNVLDRMPWESVPLGVRIVLHRAAQLARDARDAHASGRH